MRDYINLGTAYNNNVSACISEGKFITKGYKELTEEVLLSILEAFHATWNSDPFINDIEMDESEDYFRSDCDTWTEAYMCCIAGGSVDTPDGLDSEIFEELHKLGYINNGLFVNRHYYKDKYDNTWMSTSSLSTIVPIAGLQIINQDQLIEKLVNEGFIKVHDDYSYEVLQSNQPGKKTL